MNINTEILIQGCRQNDLLCQQQLYKWFYSDMIRVCMRYATDTDEAGIIYNNAMLKVFRGIGNYAEEGKLAGWIKTIVIHACIDFCKSKNNFTTMISHADETQWMIRPEALDNLSGKDIRYMISQLPGASATVFNLYVYEGFNHRQIAELLGISEGTSKWHLSEARRILKTKLDESSLIKINTHAAG
ncbi:MAG TPA: RNA polymerase sigma factor [Ferruginibacter sp.]|nr:RNA polymerase sigma factor [Ferruginibacter sp.]